MEGNSNAEDFLEPGSRNIERLGREVSIDIYAIQVADPFEEDSFIFLFDEVCVGTEEPSGQPLQINTLYKRKADKVKPVDLGVSTGETPSGRDDWFEVDRAERPALRHIGKHGDLGLVGRFSTLPQGSRLTPERINKLTIGESVTPAERELLIEVLTNREEALAFDWTHCGTVRPEVAPPQEIRTVEHEAWQVPSFPVPKSLMAKVIEMLKERLNRGTMEYSQGPYRNPWFLVAKKEKGSYRLIVAAQNINKVTIRDANMPPNMDEFSEEFSCCVVASLLDFFSGYDQVLLALKSRDMTAIQTPIGLLRVTRLPQGATNSVAQFVRIVQRIFFDIIPDKCRPYLDDVGVKGPRSYYDYEEVAPGIRRFMLEHIQNLDSVLERVERAGATIGPKSQWCMPGLKMVGFVTDADGRWPDTAKVIKITEWPDCTDASEARGFLGIAQFYRLWIKDYSRRAEPISRLLKKDALFVWGPEQVAAMNDLKEALTTAPALVQINYDKDAGAIILTVDASLTGWGAVLQQLDKKRKRHPIRYESGLWDRAQRGYDATKRECLGALRAMKKMRSYLIGIHFILETDAAVLVAQLNRAASDLPGSLLTRWIAWMRLFDFEVKHIPGKKNSAADGLSRRPRTESDDIDEAHEQDIDEWIMDQLDPFSVLLLEAESFLSPSQEGKVLRDHYSKASEQIARFLKTLSKPTGMDRKQFYRFKNKALQYTVIDRDLYRLGKKGIPMRLVIDGPEDRREVIRSCHEESGHKGKESTYRKVATRFWWDGCYSDCQKYVLSCVACQKRDGTRQEEAMYPTWQSAMWMKVGLDVTYMPNDGGKKALVVAREDLSGWPEARALSHATAEEVADFIWEEIICRHGVFGRLVIDGGPENQGIAAAFVKKYGIERIQISAYNSKAAGMVERGHRSIAEALSRMGGGRKRWRKNLAAVLLAERTSVHGPTGVTPFSLVYGREAVLPFETRYPVWRLLKWNDVQSREDLLVLRARQLQLRDDDMDEIILRKRRLREQGKIMFDKTHRIRKTLIKKDDTVLVYHSKRATDMSSDVKLAFKWLGPYRVHEANSTKGTYVLKEMDGTLLKGTYAGNRLKKFIYKDDAFIPEQSDSDGDSTTSDSDPSDSWEGDSAQDEQLPHSKRITRTTKRSNTSIEPVIIPPTLTTAQKAQYTPYL
jgi:hypothetical protein